jgi:3',5'-cyclic AMP phosphodiesterase CpdA
MPRLLHLSDPHFGAVNTAAAEAFLSHARSHTYDFTVLSGDLTMRARRTELEAAYNFVSTIPGPLLVIPGNHDIPATNQPFDRFFRPFRRYSRWFGADLEPTHRTPEFHLVSLNSTRAFGFHADWSEGILSREQLAGCVSRFHEGDRTAFRILTIHHPLLAPPGYNRAVVKPLPDLLQAVDDARVDLVLCGHFHRSQLATAGVLEGWKCVVSQAPTVCSTRLQGEPQGFHEIRFTAATVEITVWRFSGESFIPTSTSRFERCENGWKDCEDSATDEIAVIPPEDSE